ncbi:zinc-binding alcohol dehydrogenase family protein [soil metagenome]
MKAALVTEFGTSPHYREIDDPEPRSGTQLAEVLAASLKNLDRGLVSGTHYKSSSLPLPFVPGVDGVVRLGDGRLMYSSALPPHGLMAEKTIVDPAQAVTLPDGLDPVLGAAIPNPGISAWLSLETAARVREGQNVLVLGATGVTGAVAVQLAKSRFGAGRVVAVGRNTERLSWLRAHGADNAISLGAEDLAERVAAEHASSPFDAVIDYLWGPPAEQVLSALADPGLKIGYRATRFVQVGSMAGADITLPSNVLRSAGIEILGFGLGSVPADAQCRVGTDVLPALFAMVADGTLSIGADVRNLSEVEELWTSREPSGSRIVLVP